MEDSLSDTMSWFAREPLFAREGGKDCRQLRYLIRLGNLESVAETYCRALHRTRSESVGGLLWVLCEKRPPAGANPLALVVALA
jgi:hypothetical protein